MACDNPFDALKLATEYLGPELHEIASYKSVWMNFVPRGTYPQGAGLNLSTFTIGRSEPTTDEPEFTPVTLTTGETYTGSCGTNFSEVPVGYKETTYGPEKFGWKGPIICKDDLIYNWKAAAFWAKYMPKLAENTDRSISNRLSNIYTFFSPRYVANDDFHSEDGQTGTPTAAPDLTLDRSQSNLTQEMLDTVAIELIQEGAVKPDEGGWITMGESGPLFTLYVGMQMSRQLLLNNSELRRDFRFADEGAGYDSKLLRRLGSTLVINNFRHLINVYPPRYDYDGTKYVRVPTFHNIDGTKGDLSEVNPAWKTADFEGAYVMSPWVFTSKIVQPVNSAAGMNWTPTNYMGQWQFVTGGAKINNPPCYDPLEKLGRQFAEFVHAPEPIFPRYGATIIYKRCQNENFDTVTCS